MRLLLAVLVLLSLTVFAVAATTIRVTSDQSPISSKAEENNGADSDLGLTSVESCCENRGNVDHIIGPAGPVDINDILYLVEYLFRGGPIPPCPDEVEMLCGEPPPGKLGEGRGPVDVSDLTCLVAYLFTGGLLDGSCER